MGMFLNSIVPFEEYKYISKTRYFVDKTTLIDEIISSVTTEGQKYLCITRPRRFGKSVMVNMIGSFFGDVENSSEIFDNLKISKSENYQKYLNQYPEIYIDFSRMPRECKCYEQYIRRIQDGLNIDLMEMYPELNLNLENAVWDNLSQILEKRHQKFIFVFDEWDAIFHKEFTTENDKKAYLEFLRDLLKGQPYVKFVYMTGVLPITKYSSGSELNMFSEYDMATKEKFSDYFGFSDSEIDQLYDIYRSTTKTPKITRAELAEWYNGYHTAAGERMYNPRSIVCALTDNQLSNYWTNSGPYDEIFHYIRNNIDDVKDDLALMVSGERIGIKLQGYAATSEELNTKNQIYSAMVVYGLLTYEENEVFIPNRELMDKFNELLLLNDSLGYVHSLAKESEKMLKATLAGDIVTMTEILEFAHNTEVPILSYNNEVDLSAMINLIYLSARDKYRVEREDKAGKGYVDFIFYPEKKGATALILELKINSTPEAAIAQIKEKNYALKFQGTLGDRTRYNGDILAVGITYNKKTKQHFCKVEKI